MMRGPGGPGGGPGGTRFRESVKAKDLKKTTGRLVKYVSKQSILLIGVVLCVVASTAAMLISPNLIRIVIDQYIAAGIYRQMTGILALMIGMHAIAALLSYLQSIFMAKVSQKSVYEIRRDLFDHIQTLPVRYFDSTPYGELMSRLSNDVDNISMTMNQAVSQLIQSSLSVVGALAFMIYLNLPLAALTLLMIPLSLFLTNLIAKRTRSMYKGQQAALGALNGFVEETISGQRIVKIFAREAQMQQSFDGLNVDYKQKSIRAQIFSGIVGPMMNMMNNFSFIIVAAAGGLFVANGAMSVGAITSFTQYVRQFTRPVNELANQFTQLQSALASAERVFEIMDEPSEQDRPTAQPLEDIVGEVVINNLTFGYNADRVILDDVSMYAKPGDVIALVGPTGAGKTTIVNLLTRFYEIDGGSITIDGRDIREATLPTLRRGLGIVLQDVKLFAGTVRDNVRYGKLEATDQEVEEAAKAIGADHFINRLADGFDTTLTDDGSNLSHGQRQLLSIARAVLANPSVLILDEATSSVDTRTELIIQRAMLRLMEGRTSFVIAHRLSTIRDAKAILVINDGRIIERGNHQQLLEQNGFYAKLYASQFRRQEKLLEDVERIG